MNHEAFLDVITVRPNDSDARQVYADWLELQGDLRCEIVRLHDQLRRQTPSASAYASEVADLRARVKGWLHQARKYPSVSMNTEARGAWLDRMGIFTSPLSTDHVRYIDLQRKHPLVACRFHATWSAPCVQFRSVYREVAQRLAPWCVFLEADIDENADWAPQLRVTAVPTIMISKQQRLQPLLVGVTTIDKLLTSVEEWLIEEW